MDLVRHHCSDTHTGGQFSGLSFDGGFEQEPIVNDALLVGIGLEPMMPLPEGETPATNGKVHNGINGAPHMNGGMEE